MTIPLRIILRNYLAGLFLTFAALVNGQEFWGISTSNYAGSNGVYLNPTSVVNSKLYMDINLVTANIFLENNYVYIHNEDYSLTTFLRKNPQLPEYGPDEMPVDRFTDKFNKYAYASELVKGPSFMLSVGRHGFALHTGARVLSSLYRIPYHVANFGYYGLDYTEQHNIEYRNRNMGGSALAMGEIGLTYAYSFRKFSNEDWSAGITLKRMFPLAGGYVQGRDVDYIVVNDSTINIKNMDAEVGFSFPLDYDNNDFPDDGPWIKGGGFGVDLGVTFQNKILSYQKRRITKLCRQRYVDYYFKVGVSILDLGFVNFNKNAQLVNYDNVSRYWINVDTMNYYNMNELVRTLSTVFYGDPNASDAGSSFRVALPTALSVQADYKVHMNWYAGAVLVQPVRMAKSYLRRPAQLALVPRYETPGLEFSLPLSLYDWKYPRVGFSVRYEALTFGTDDLLGFLGITNFTGTDFYLSLKINYRKGNCGRGSRNVPCENGEYGLKRPR